MDSIYEEYSRIMHIAKLIYKNKLEDLIDDFGNITENLVNFNSNLGTIPHICIYLRNINFLRSIVNKFDDTKCLLDWLSEKDANGLTTIDLICKFEFQEIYIYFNKILLEKSMKSENCILKEGYLSKYTNILNGYKKRYVILTLDFFYYGKKKDIRSMKKLSINDIAFEPHASMKKFKLTSKKIDMDLVFKGHEEDDLFDWIGLLQNIMNSRNKDFYYKNFVFKIINDLFKKTDEKAYKIFSMVEFLRFYTEDKHLKITQEVTLNGKRSSNQDSNYEDTNELNNTNYTNSEVSKNAVINTDDNTEEEYTVGSDESIDKKAPKEEIELFSFESDENKAYEFYEVEDKKQ